MHEPFDEHAGQRNVNARRIGARNDTLKALAAVPGNIVGLHPGDDVTRSVVGASFCRRRQQTEHFPGHVNLALLGCFFALSSR